MSIFFWACQSKKGKITFYISNVSKVDTLVSIKVSVDGNKVVDSTFAYADVVPNDEVFITEYPLRDSVTISATASAGASTKFKIKFDKNAYVFLGYVHDSLLTKSEKAANERMKKELNGFDPSILLEKKAIPHLVQYNQPILY